MPRPPREAGEKSWSKVVGLAVKAEGSTAKTVARARMKEVRERSARAVEKGSSAVVVREGGAMRRWWLKRVEGRRQRARMVREAWRLMPGMEVNSQKSLLLL